MKITELQLQSPIQKALLKRGYTDFTPIQEKVLPSLIDKKDVLAEAPTGTGKTAAYSIPLLESLDLKSNNVQALVICPTRELALQVIEELDKFSIYLPGVRCVPIYGGQKVNTQLRSLRNHPQVIVGTPGRLNDFIERRVLDLSKVHYLVLDECDEMLEMGFIKDENKILSYITGPHQTGLFSATISPEIKSIAQKYLKPDAVMAQVKREPGKENQISQKYIMVREDRKKDAIVDLINNVSFTRAFVFCRTKHKVIQIAKLLTNNTAHHTITSLQGNLSQNKRDRSMKAFREYKADVMVATDIAARGIDVNDVDLVVNYDIPEEDEFYLHRIGRTGRVDKTGVSITFLTKEEKYLIEKYQKMTKATLEEYAINNITSMKKYLEVPIVSSVKRSATSNKNSEGKKEKGQNKPLLFNPNGNQRFFINVGYKDGADNRDLKRYIMEKIPKLTDKDFKDIYMKETYSFFEVPAIYTKDVIFDLENTTFATKNVHIERTERPESSRFGKNNRRNSEGHNDNRREERDDSRRGGRRNNRKSEDRIDNRRDDRRDDRKRRPEDRIDNRRDDRRDDRKRRPEDRNDNRRDDRRSNNRDDRRSSGRSDKRRDDRNKRPFSRQKRRSR